MVHDRPGTERIDGALSVAYGLLAARMILALVIGVPLTLIVVYGFWLASQLGRGPSWRRASKRNRS